MFNSDNIWYRAVRDVRRRGLSIGGSYTVAITYDLTYVKLPYFVWSQGISAHPKVISLIFGPVSRHYMTRWRKMKELVPMVIAEPRHFLGLLYCLLLLAGVYFPKHQAPVYMNQQPTERSSIGNHGFYARESRPFIHLIYNFREIIVFFCNSYSFLINAEEMSDYLSNRGDEAMRFHNGGSLACSMDIQANNSIILTQCATTRHVIQSRGFHCVRNA